MAASTERISLDEQIARLLPEEREPVRAFFAAYPPGQGAPVAVVIPAYDEEPTVAAVIREIPSEIAGQATEVIVVNDGSSDNTVAEARGAGALVCDIPVNRGQGLIFMLGYWLARTRGAKVIATIDADGQFLASELQRVVEPVLSGRADFVNGSRRLGTELTTDPIRHAGVIFFGKLVSVLVGQRITDPACGIRAFTSDLTAAVKLQQIQYQTSEILIASAMNGFRVMEVPTTMQDRPDGATLTKKGPNLLYGMRFARAVLGTWRRERKRARTRPASANTQYS
jgi:glycosyltransferase involved in cell wall biosynthesis